MSSEVTADVKEHYDYDYPEGLDFSPKSELQKRITAQVLQRARESSTEMSSKHSTWDKIDETLNVFIPLSEKEQEVKLKDSRKPVSIVVPVSFAVQQVWLTHFVATFLSDPVFQYEGTGPEDRIGTILLEQLVNQQYHRARMGLDLYTMARDASAYGFGVVTPQWKTKYGWRSVVKETQKYNWMGFQSGSSKERVLEQGLTYEGNTLDAIDPRRYLPDPNVSIHDPQAGEFVGWVVEDNVMSLLSEEESNPDLFNVRYLKRESPMRSSVVPARSDYASETISGASNISLRTGTAAAPSTNPVDVIWMYIRLIPKEWKLGDGEYPETWLFAVAGDSMTIFAKQYKSAHNGFPVAVYAPNFDGRTVTPVSMLEMIYGLQENINWRYNAHTHNWRKALNDMFIVDSSIISVADVKDPRPGMLVRVRKAFQGRQGAIHDAITQLKVSDVTQGYMADIMATLDLIHRVTGAVDTLQGVMRTGGERRSAIEARDTRSSALSRLEMGEKLASLMAMQEVARILGSNTQEFMTQETYVKNVGRNEEDLRKEYGVNPRIPVSPLDIVTNYDVIPKDATSGSGQHVDAQVQMFQILASQPWLAQSFDMFRLFKHIMRSTGAQNLVDFEKKQEQGLAPQLTLASDDVVQKQAQAGNIVPANLGAA